MADYMAANIVDFVRGFGQRKKDARVNDHLKNYLADPEGTVRAIMADDPRFGIALEEKTTARNTARTAAARSNTDADLGLITKVLRGLPKDADVGAEFDKVAPLIAQTYGTKPEALAALRGIVTTPGALAGMDDKAFAEMAKSRYGTTVGTPGSHIWMGGEKVDEVPFAAKTVNTAPGVQTTIFDPNTRQFVTGAPGTGGSPAAAPADPLASSFDAAFAPTQPSGPKAGGRPVPQRATGQMVEQMVGRLAPGAQMTSGVRSEKHNADVGGDEDSYHLARRGGIARDYVPGPGETMGQLHAKLKSGFGPGWDVINEGDHIHIEPSPQYARFAGGGSAPAAAAAPVAAAAAPNTTPGSAPTVTPTGVYNPPKPSTAKPPTIVRMATPEELAHGGYPPGTAAQIDSNGKLVNIKTPPAAVQKDASSRVGRAQALTDQMTLLSRSAAKLVRMPGLEAATGFLAGHVPGAVLGQDAQDFINELTNLKQNIGLGKLMEFKSQSAQGASGFGNLSNEEGRRLEAAFGQLERTSSPAEVRATLRNILSMSATILKRQADGFSAAAKTGAPPPPAVGTIKAGYRFKGGNPADQASWEKVQ